MFIQRFTRGPTKTLDEMAPGDLFFGDESTEVIRMKLDGLPPPDPATVYCARLSDGHIDGAGKGDVFATCAAVLEPL